MQPIERLRDDEGNNLPLRLWSAQWCPAADPSKKDVTHGQSAASGGKLDIAIRRRLKGGDERIARQFRLYDDETLQRS